mmetsp:Transcript_39462/g.74064  ORF Transcript_39462/g.74064 Transcript_39462/m.74064 type:complete len:382 (+) Transcript_39462:991-2136(+)
MTLSGDTLWVHVESRRKSTMSWPYSFCRWCMSSLGLCTFSASSNILLSASACFVILFFGSSHLSRNGRLSATPPRYLVTLVSGESRSMSNAPGSSRMPLLFRSARWRDNERLRYTSAAAASSTTPRTGTSTMAMSIESPLLLEFCGAMTVGGTQSRTSWSNTCEVRRSPGRGSHTTVAGSASSASATCPLGVRNVACITSCTSGLIELIPECRASVNSGGISSVSVPVPVQLHRPTPSPARLAHWVSSAHSCPSTHLLVCRLTSSSPLERISALWRVPPNSQCFTVTRTAAAASVLVSFPTRGAAATSHAQAEARAIQRWPSSRPSVHVGSFGAVLTESHTSSLQVRPKKPESHTHWPNSPSANPGTHSPLQEQAPPPSAS